MGENPAARTRNRHQDAPLQAPAYRPLSPLIAVDANAKVIGSATCKCVCISVCVFMFVCVCTFVCGFACAVAGVL